ncbi:ABC-three component system middle component 1 [Carnobacterium gallinarum]|uniref:ABC-three component system middle component 1 n=1 Tax=Carnobacterium gallinarum TaxID=2749 RepID=UPI000559919E|nr:ABC-three component system middle component 1 [Carnobacterium gallinarum]
MDNQLKKIYTQLFSELGYVKDEKIHDYFFNEETNSFYTCSIIDENESNQAIENWAVEQERLFQLVMGAQENPHRIKNNTTHLVFYVTENENQNFIFELEEDEYYFKKNVIVLTQQEITDFEKKSLDSGYNTYKLFLENTIDSNDLFKNYKESKEKNYYSMILKFYIKIPSLYLFKSVTSNELKTLNESIEENLTEEELIGFNNQIIGDINEYISQNSEQDAELKNFDIETVLEKWIGEDNCEK